MPNEDQYEVLLSSDARVRTCEKILFKGLPETPFRPERLLVRDEGSERGAGDWIIKSTEPTNTHERPLGPELSSRAAAKRAAMKLVHEGTRLRIEVWHRWRGDRYMQGLAGEEGWSDV